MTETIDRRRQSKLLESEQEAGVVRRSVAEHFEVREDKPNNAAHVAFAAHR